MPQHFYVHSLRDITPHTRMISLCPTSKEIKSCKPGQYAHLAFEGYDFKPFSIASQDSQGCLTFFITRGGQGARAYATEKLAIGESVDIEGPFGTMYENLVHDAPCLFIAGGTGIAPILSLLKAKSQMSQTKPVRLYYGARNSQELIEMERLKDLRGDFDDFEFHIILSQKQDRTDYRTGFIHEILMNDFKNLKQWRAYLAGPPPMISATLPVLKNLKLKAGNIYTDLENLSQADLDLLVEKS